jgi:tetratricopeptide (TPR) repeat protein
LELGLHSTHGRVAAEEGIGLAYYHLGDFHQAQHWLELASGHAHPIGHIRRYIIALTGLGMVKIQAWQLESSMIYLEKAIKAAKESECNEGLSRALAVLARAYRLCGDGETALEYAARAIQIAREVVLPACLMFGEVESGLAHLALGDPVTAAEHTRAAMELMASAGECWLGAEEIFRAQALILKSLGNLSASDKYNQQAKDIIDAKAKHIPDPKLRQQYLEIHSFD